MDRNEGEKKGFERGMHTFWRALFLEAWREISLSTSSSSSSPKTGGGRRVGLAGAGFCWPGGIRSWSPYFFIAPFLSPQTLAPFSASTSHFVRVTGRCRMRAGAIYIYIYIGRSRMNICCMRMRYDIRTRIQIRILRDRVRHV